MKKLVSLLLAVMLVMSMMTFNVMASTDTEVLPTSSAKYENALAVGGSTVTATNTNGYRTNASGAVVVAMEDETDATNTNKIFKVMLLPELSRVHQKLLVYFLVERVS